MTARVGQRAAPASGRSHGEFFLNVGVNLLQPVRGFWPWQISDPPYVATIGVNLAFQ